VVQLSFLDLKPRCGTIAERFAAWIEANPHAFELFRQFALEAMAAGQRRFSADAIVQRIRWHMAVEMVRTDGLPFKINDHYSAHLARMLIESDPRFIGFFELRQLRSGND
jgi:hypothetical protein